MLKRSLLFSTGLALAASASFGEQARPVTDAVLKNAGKTGTEWLSYGLTPGETRYSPLNQINASNVSRLGLAWSYDIGSGGGNQEATPLVFERHPLQHHQLERGLRGRRAHGQREMALGSGSEPDRGAPETLLRNRESRHRALQRENHRPDARRQARGARCGDRQGGLGIARVVSRRTITPSPWRPASPKAR